MALKQLSWRVKGEDDSTATSKQGECYCHDEETGLQHQDDGYARDHHIQTAEKGPTGNSTICSLPRFTSLKSHETYCILHRISPSCPSSRHVANAKHCIEMMKDILYGEDQG